MSRPLYTPSGKPLTIGPYVAEQLLGRGAMGTVYGARKEGEALLAIKTLALDDIGESREQAIERFTREVQAVTSLHHPGIVRVYDAGRAEVETVGEVLYYVMEVIEGETLHQALKRGPFYPSEAAAIVVKVADALNFAHGFGIVHRDIKPANVFYTPQQRVIIADFGVCKFTNLQTVSTEGSLVGTIPFLAPEQILEQPVDARSDVFAMGAMLYTLITRRYLRPPSSIKALVEAVNQERDEDQVRALTAFEPALVEVMARCVTKNPDQRYQLARELIDALWPMAGDMPLPGSDRVVAPRDGQDSTQIDVLPDLSSEPSDPLLQAPQARFELKKSTTPMPEDSPHTPVPRERKTGPLPKLPKLPSEMSDKSTQEAEAARHALVLKAGRQDLPKVSDLLKAQAARHEAAKASAPDPFAVARGEPVLGPMPEGLAFEDPDDMQVDMGDDISGKVLRHLPKGATGKEVGQGEQAMERLSGMLSKPHLFIPAAAACLLLIAVVVWQLLLLRSVTLQIESIPKGAAVRVNGVDVGATPFVHKASRRAGKLNIELRATEREPYVHELELPLFGSLDPLVVAMPFEFAHLKVVTEPRGATVLLDGAAFCQSSCTVDKVVPRERHYITVDKEGCESVVFDLETEPGQKLERVIKLKPMTLGSLALLQVLSDGQPVFLDGEEVTEAFRHGELLVVAGLHRLEIGAKEARKLYPLDLPRGATRRIDVRKRPRKPGKPQLLNAAALRRENRKKGEIEATFSASMDYALFQLAQGKLGTAKTFMVQALAIEEKSARAQRGMIMVAAASKQSKLARGHIHTFLNLPDAPDDTPLVRRMSQFIGKPEVCLGK